MDNLSKENSEKFVPIRPNRNNWSAISNLKLGQAMEKGKSRRSGRTIKRGDTKKIAADVQELSRVTSTAHKNRTKRMYTYMFEE